MRKILTILTIISTLAVTTVRAQYVRVNFDFKTIAAMTSAFGTESVAEVYYKSQIKDILDHYTTAEVAAAGIFSSKYLDRKALTHLGILSDGAENYYYRRIYNLVSAKIMPKIWTVSKMMLKSPQSAIYWGSYIMKVCTEVKSLCMQFEQVVTNSSLSFKDIAFLELKQDVADLVNLSDIGNVDWKTFFEGFGDNISGRFSKESLQQDLDHLYEMGANLAGAGVSNLMGGSSFDDIIQGKLPAIFNTVESAGNFIESLDNGVGDALLQLVGGEEGVANLFELSSYNLTEWQSIFTDDGMGRYYTQRWYIYRVDQGSETLCNYEPPTDDNSVLYGDHWYRIDTKDANFSPSSSQREAILQNSEAHAGWSRSRVNQLINQAPSGHSYTFSNWLSAYILSKSKSGQYAKAYAYSITVTHSWYVEEEVYDDVFDSYTMDLTTFRSVLNARLSEYNDNDEGYTYYIGYDNKNYYQASDIEKLQGCEEALISVTCTDGTTLGQGSTQYKCNRCGGSLNNHTKECVMATSVSDNDLDTSELDQQESEAQQHVTQLQQQIGQLEAENASILKQISSASVEEAARLRQQYNANLTKISQLKSELKTWQQNLADIQQAKDEASHENDAQTDDYYRIPAIMQDCKLAYNLTWQGEGHWNGWTYERDATMPNIRGTIHFKAKVSLVRKPKYFLGIKIHRAIIGIEWELTANYSDTQVVKVVDLDPNMDEAQKQQIVNNAISEVARSYPSCQVSTEYIKSEPIEEDESGDAYHLLWASDRIEIARQIETRLSHIYADLVSLEKMMHYKLSILDVWKRYGPYINDQAGRHDLLQEAHQRWMNNARLRRDRHDYHGERIEESEREFTDQPLDRTIETPVINRP